MSLDFLKQEKDISKLSILKINHGHLLFPDLGWQQSIGRREFLGVG
jgi:hypothetical protein